MLDQKTKIRAAIRARDALAEMKRQRYKQLQARLDKFTLAAKPNGSAFPLNATGWLRRRPVLTGYSGC